MNNLSEHIKTIDLIYLATPYSKYPAGIEMAFRDAAKLAGRLLMAGVKVYSPIAHGHPLSVHGGVNPLDHETWLAFDAAMMAKADALLVAKLDTWEKSFGIAHEISVFKNARKPFYYLTPDSLAVSDAP